MTWRTYCRPSFNPFVSLGVLKPAGELFKSERPVFGAVGVSNVDFRFADPTAVFRGCGVFGPNASNLRSIRYDINMPAAFKHTSQTRLYFQEGHLSSPHHAAADFSRDSPFPAIPAHHA